MSDRAWPGWEQCETCGGSGVGHKVYDGTGVEFIDCLDCASGFVPPVWQVEAAARDIQSLYNETGVDWEEETDKTFYVGAARIALVAAAKAEREERG